MNSKKHDKNYFILFFSKGSVKQFSTFLSELVDGNFDF